MASRKIIDYRVLFACVVIAYYVGLALQWLGYISNNMVSKKGQLHDTNVYLNVHMGYFQECHDLISPKESSHCFSLHRSSNWLNVNIVLSILSILSGFVPAAVLMCTRSISKYTKLSYIIAMSVSTLFSFIALVIYEIMASDHMTESVINTFQRPLVNSDGIKLAYGSYLGVIGVVMTLTCLLLMLPLPTTEQQKMKRKEIKRRRKLERIAGYISQQHPNPMTLGTSPIKQNIPPLRTKYNPKRRSDIEPIYTSPRNSAEVEQVYQITTPQNYEQVIPAIYEQMSPRVHQQIPHS